MTKDWAETLALQVLAYIIAESMLCSRFLDLTGLQPEYLQAGLSDPAFMRAVLEFLLADEPNLLKFCAEAGIDPHAPARAHALLMGDAAPEWN